MKKTMLFTISIVAVIAIIVTLIYFYIGDNSYTKTSSVKDFKVTVLDIGKADSIFFNIGDKNVLLDTGEDDNAKYILSFLEKNNIKKIDYMIITHFDKDHVGGADIILDNINVSNVIQPKYEKSSKQYNQYVDSLNKKNIKPVSLNEKMSLNLNGAEFTIYPPNKESYVEGDNDFSLVTSVKHGNNSFLFTGDAESERLQELLSLRNLKHTFLKVPHHGKYSSNSKDFFSAVNPKYAFITCSNKNPADAKVLSLLKSLNVKTYLTKNGDIKIYSGGNRINITQ